MTDAEAADCLTATAAGGRAMHTITLTRNGQGPVPTESERDEGDPDEATPVTGGTAVIWGIKKEADAKRKGS
ncbi:hypothetical protein [Streptomyces sp. NPDC048720]|uniref:hypothetical protein n=1 Tax=Streptomyces sp. NPDC048720 TaxID=3365588 RepID=UPI00371A4311